jgi:hypothetical protein
VLSSNCSWMRSRPSFSQVRNGLNSGISGPLEFHIDFENAVYDFVRPHGSLRRRLRRPGPHGRLWVARSPTMAVGLTDHIWNLEELMSRCPPPHG